MTVASLLVMSTGRLGPHCREDGGGDLKMAVSLEFGHFQHLGWK
jgi:hypothetical protein